MAECGLAGPNSIPGKVRLPHWTDAQTRCSIHCHCQFDGDWKGGARLGTKISTSTFGDVGCGAAAIVRDCAAALRVSRVSGVSLTTWAYRVQKSGFYPSMRRDDAASMRTLLKAMNIPRMCRYNKSCLREGF